MTRLEWWVGIVVLVVAVAAHACLPRYDVIVTTDPARVVRLDRWTGRVEVARGGTPWFIVE
jgi:hypothetical protein